MDGFPHLAPVSTTPSDLSRIEGRTECQFYCPSWPERLSVYSPNNHPKRAGPRLSIVFLSGCCGMPSPSLSNERFKASVSHLWEVYETGCRLRLSWKKAHC